MHEFSMNFNVQFSDIDKNIELTNRGFLRLLQEVAGIHSDKIGYSIRTAKTTGVCWILLNWKLKILSRPKWNDKITIISWVRHTDKHFSFRDFKVLDENNNLLAVAASKWTLVNTNTHSLVMISDELLKKYPIADIPDAFLEEPFNKIQEPAKFNNTLEYIVQRRDIDANHHINNLSYLDFAYEILPSDFYFNDLEIIYKREANYADTLIVSYSKSLENEFIVVIKEKESNKTNVILKLK